MVGKRSRPSSRCSQATLLQSTGFVAGLHGNDAATDRAGTGCRRRDGRRDGRRDAPSSASLQLRESERSSLGIPRARHRRAILEDGVPNLPRPIGDLMRKESIHAKIVRFHKLADRRF